MTSAGAPGYVRGFGASSRFGAGGTVQINSNGGNGSGFGSGGGGCINSVSQSAVAGGSGAPGMFEIWEFA
ncbi:MAG TPA: hypothetical protein VKT70_09135 [Stellaceae bacterium]|nr:hypothetical protein [Stellaceae bacterium]